MCWTKQRTLKPNKNEIIARRKSLFCRFVNIKRNSEIQKSYRNFSCKFLRYKWSYQRNNFVANFE